MEKVDLKAILAKHLEVEVSGFFNLDKSIQQAVFNTLNEVWNTAVDKCKENATLSFIPYDEEAWETTPSSIKREDILEFYADGEDNQFAVEELLNRDGFEIEVDKNSIEQVKQMIL